MENTFRRLGLACASAVLLSMAGCGGGGSDKPASGNPDPNNPDPGSTSHSISGTAAVGAPLTGTVTVKDALGATKTQDIGTNGAYSVDVTGMTAPFVFRASGVAGGQTYTVHSIATAADVDGKINITQLTDLVVANIAGQIAQNYFDKFEQDNNTGAASKAAVDAEVAKLKEKLLPVLQALGVEASVDLLRTPFTPAASALDKALDAIQVSVDPNSNIATISTLVNSIAITDDLATKAEAETSPATLSADNVSAETVATALGDTTLVKKALTDLAAKFATGLPTAAQLTPLLTTGFRHEDLTGTVFAEQASTFSAFVGGSIAGIEIHQIDYSDPTKATARVSFSFKDKNGIEMDRARNWRVRKGPDGVWRVHGDQRVLATSVAAHMTKGITAFGTCILTGIEFRIEDFDTANNGGNIGYVQVTGPGLPTGGLRYERPETGGLWVINGTMTPYFTMADSCADGEQPVPDSQIAMIPDLATYTLTAFTSAGTKVAFPTGTLDGTYTLKVMRRPMTLAEAKAAVFPTIASPTLAALSGYQSGALAVSAGKLNPSKYTWLYLGQNTDTGDFRETEVDLAPAADGTLSTSMTLTPASSGSISWNTFRVESLDAYRRELMTLYFAAPQ